ncbi:MAG: DUF2723 domain-containing protein [Anaerolineae bacterium]|nr:DUF2723 domain-containing protein [Anaerolineae bacterium]
MQQEQTRPCLLEVSSRCGRAVACLASAMTIGRADYALATALGAMALIAFGRTLAPDILYGDSAEFQALAYTLGMTHSTGYPTYLLLARVLGFIPLGSPAWRVSLLSALSAAVAVGAVYLLARHLTRSRVGALLGGVALALSHTFWSQAIIAEVYTPAMAFLAVIILLLWRWRQAPERRSGVLLAAGLLAGIGLGVHASVALILPSAALLVAWVLRPGPVAGCVRRRLLALGALGLAVGTGLFVLNFYLMELRDSPTGFSRVVMYPSRSIWGLTARDMDSPLERMLLIALGRQWRSAMFPGGWSFLQEALKRYLAHLPAEFPPATLLLALVGMAAALVTAPELGAFLLVSLITMLAFILNYEPPDKVLFYLPTYLPIAVAAGGGAGVILELAYRGLSAPGRRAWLALYLVPALLLGVWVAGPLASSRWQALRAGAGTFVGESYPYPLRDLAEPRRVAAQRLQGIPQGAILVLDWRTLYAACYLAHVEQGRTDLRFIEATPYGGSGGLAQSLI